MAARETRERLMAVQFQPLDRFPVVRTQNADEMCAALTRIYAKPRLDLAAQAKKVDVAINHYPLNSIGLGNTRYGIGVSLVYPDSEVVLHSFPIRGRGQAAVDGSVVALSPRQGVTVSPHMNFAATLADNYETLLLLINPQMLAGKLEAIVGLPLGEPLRFHPALNYASPAARALRNHFVFLVEMVNASPAPLPRLLLAEYEETLALMFLYANRHNHSHRLEQVKPDIAFSQVLQAEEYIAANADRAITVEELAGVTGVSVRSLFRAFKKARGVSPLEFAQQVRLRRARDLLRRADTPTTVGEIVSACGYVDLDQFAGDYVRMFGEPPPQSVLRGRGEEPTRH
jgi:AraC-like DNA-binding protein